MTKDEYNNVFKAALSENGSQVDPHDIWLNPRRGLRLTHFGFHTLRNDIGLDPTFFVLDDDWSQNKMMLSLEKYMPSPYFLLSSYQEVAIFSGKVAMSIGLIGSVEQYTKNIENHKNNH